MVLDPDRAGPPTIRPTLAFDRSCAIIHDRASAGECGAVEAIGVDVHRNAGADVDGGRGNLRGTIKRERPLTDHVNRARQGFCLVDGVGRGTGDFDDEIALARFRLDLDDLDSRNAASRIRSPACAVSNDRKSRSRKFTRHENVATFRNRVGAILRA